MNKNEELQKWLNDDRYVRRCELDSMFGLSDSGSRTFLIKHKISPCKVFAEKGAEIRFYDKNQCIEIRQKQQRGQDDIEEYANNKLYIRPYQLEKAWGLCRSSVSTFLISKKIKPVKRFLLASFYDRAECERARPFINQPEQKEVEKVENIGELATMKDLMKFTGKSRYMIMQRFINKGITPISKPLIGKTVSYVYDLQQSLAVLSDILKPQYRKLIASETKEIKTMEKKQMELPEPKEQTPDIIPADTIDLFTMSELETEFNKRGVELTAEVRAKINASDMPEMQHIATMLRGNAKTITIWLSVLNEIAGNLRKAKCVEVVKSNAGAKCKHCPEFDKIAFDMASANKTDEEIAQNLKISIDTFYRYKREITSFANALNSGKAANPFTIKDSQGKERADRYFELKDFMEMQKQINDMQQMIEILVKKLDGVNMTEKKMFIKNGKVDKVIVTETKLENKNNAKTEKEI